MIRNKQDEAHIYEEIDHIYSNIGRNSFIKRSSTSNGDAYSPSDDYIEMKDSSGVFSGEYSYMNISSIANNPQVVNTLTTSTTSVLQNASTQSSNNEMVENIRKSFNFVPIPTPAEQKNGPNCLDRRAARESTSSLEEFSSRFTEYKRKQNNNSSHTKNMYVSSTPKHKSQQLRRNSEEPTFIRTENSTVNEASPFLQPKNLHKDPSPIVTGRPAVDNGTDRDRWPTSPPRRIYTRPSNPNPSENEAHQNVSWCNHSIRLLKCSRDDVCIVFLSVVITILVIYLIVEVARRN